MGKTAMGGTQLGQSADLLAPQQRDFLSGVLGNAAPQAGESYRQFLQPQGVGDYQELFEKSYVNPAMQTFNRQVLPSIQQQFVDAGAGSSSALNQALAEAATDVTTNLGSQFGNFFQQQQQNKLGALGQLGGLAGQKTLEPTTEEIQGWLGPVLDAVIKAAGFFV